MANSSSDADPNADIVLPSDEPIPPTVVPPIELPSEPRVRNISVGFVQLTVSSARQTKPRVWSVFVVFVLSMIFSFIAAGISFVIAAVGFSEIPVNTPDDLQRAIENAISDPRATLILGFATGASFLLVTLIATALSPVPWRERLNLHRPQIRGFDWIAAVIGTLCVGTVFSAVQELGLLPESTTINIIAETIGSARNHWLWFAFVVIGVMPGIDEELLFRGYIQTRLAKRWNAAVAIIITALLFGLMHADPVHSLFATAMGIYLGYLTILARSIIPAIVCHACNNSISVAISAWAPEMNESNSTVINIAAIVASILILVLCVGYLRREAAKFNANDDG
jgi:uncharacterized protein